MNLATHGLFVDEAVIEGDMEVSIKVKMMRLEGLNILRLDEKLKW